MIIYFVAVAIFLILVILIILIVTKVIAPKTTFNPLLQQFLFDNSLENGFCTDIQKAAGVPCNLNYYFTSKRLRFLELILNS